MIHSKNSAISAPFQADSVDLQLHGLSSWGSSLVSLCSEIIFENIKDGLIDDLRNGFKDRANSYILDRVVLPKDFHYHEDELLIDALLYNANAYVILSRHEPLKVDEYRDLFQVRGLERVFLQFSVAVKYCQHG